MRKLKINTNHKSWAFMNRTHNHGCKGFTLLEILIVLVIIGVFTGTLVGLYEHYRNGQGRTQTEENIQAVARAIAMYQVTNGHYPCPASITATRDTAEYGKAMDCRMPAAGPDVGIGSCAPDKAYCVQQASADRTLVLNPGSDNASIRVRIGVVPFRDMPVTENQTYDGYKSRLYYAVTEQLAAPGKYSEEKGAIRITDANGTNLTTPADSAKFLVFSAGPDQVGGINENAYFKGETTPKVISNTSPCNYATTPSNIEDNNCDFFFSKMLAAFVASDRRDVDGVNKIDDVVLFDQSAGSVDTGGWRAGDPSIVLNGVSESKNDLILQGNRSVVIGTTSTRQTDAALHIAAGPIAGGGDLRVEDKIDTDQICDKDGNCFKQSALVKTCPDGQYVTGFGKNGTDGSSVVYCNKAYFGCEPDADGKERILKGRDASNKPICVYSDTISNDSVKSGTGAQSGTSTPITIIGHTDPTQSDNIAGESCVSGSKQDPDGPYNCDFRPAPDNCSARTLWGTGGNCMYQDVKGIAGERAFKQYNKTLSRNCTTNLTYTVTDTSARMDCCYLEEDYTYQYRRIDCPQTGACTMKCYTSQANAENDVNGVPRAQCGAAAKTTNLLNPTTTTVMTDAQLRAKWQEDQDLASDSIAEPSFLPGSQIRSLPGSAAYPYAKGASGGCGPYAKSGWIVQKVYQVVNRYAAPCESYWITINSNCACQDQTYCATNPTCDADKSPDRCQWKVFHGGDDMKVKGTDNVNRCSNATALTTVIASSVGQCKPATYKWTLNGAVSTGQLATSGNATNEGDPCTVLNDKTSCVGTEGGKKVIYNKCLCEKNVIQCSGGNPANGSDGTIYTPGMTSPMQTFQSQNVGACQ